MRAALAFAVLSAALAGPPAACGARAEEPAEDVGSLLQVRLDTAAGGRRGRQAAKASTGIAAPFRQTLNNMADLQYSGEVHLGNQSIAAVLDTGSFEILAFSASCLSCGMAAEGGYDSAASSTYEEGMLVKNHAYGSGNAMAYDGIDTFEVAGLLVRRQDFWEAVSAYMPVLQTASFQAIVGLGPPGEPQQEVQTVLESDYALLGSYLQAGDAVPSSVQQQLQQDQEVAELIMAKRDNVLQNFGVRYFSACFEWVSGRPGYLVWNDVAPSSHTVPFKSIPTIGNTSWSTNLTSASFSGPEGVVSLGCQGGCEALLDTGTSLIAVPTSIYNLALSELDKLDADCNNMDLMPNLAFTIGGHEFSLPPQSYVGVVQGVVPVHAQSAFRRGSQARHSCELLLMDSGDVGTGPFGPLWILGMPFFRYYYTTFDLGQDPMNPSGRTIWTAPASMDCYPAGEEEHMARLGLARKQPLWHVDISKVRVNQRLAHPRTIWNASRPAFAKLAKLAKLARS